MEDTESFRSSKHTPNEAIKIIETSRDFASQDKNNLKNNTTIAVDDTDTKELTDAAIQIQGQVRRNIAKKRVVEMKKDRGGVIDDIPNSSSFMNDSDDEELFKLFYLQSENNVKEVPRKMTADVACDKGKMDTKNNLNSQISTADERSAKLRADAKARRQAEKARAAGEDALQTAANKGYISTTTLSTEIDKYYTNESSNKILAPTVKDSRYNTHKNKKKPLYQRIMDDAVVQAMTEENKKMELLNKYRAIKNGVNINGSLDTELHMRSIDQKLKDARDKYIAKEYRYTPSAVDKLETPRSPRYIVQEYRNKVSKVSDDSEKIKKVSPLRTRYNIAIKKKILKQKEDSLNNEIEKLQRIERGKEYAQKVRDFFLPATTNKAPSLKFTFNDSVVHTNSFQSSVREKKISQHEVNDNYRALPFFQDLMREYELSEQESNYTAYNKRKCTSVSSDDDLHQNSELSSNMHNLSPRAPINSTKNGYNGRANKHILSIQSSWVNEILHKHDPQEKNLADVYEQGFYVLMLENKM